MCFFDRRRVRTLRRRRGTPGYDRGSQEEFAVGPTSVIYAATLWPLRLMSGATGFSPRALGATYHCDVEQLLADLGHTGAGRAPSDYDELLIAQRRAHHTRHSKEVLPYHVPSLTAQKS